MRALTRDDDAMMTSLAPVQSHPHVVLPGQPLGGWRFFGEEVPPMRPGELPPDRIPPAFAAHPVQQTLFPSIDAAMERGRKDAAAWLQTHPTQDDRKFAKFALGRLAPPPGDRESAQELRTMHEVKRSRTPQQNEIGWWNSRYGGHEIWEHQLEGYAKTAPADQAKRAAAMLGRAADITDLVKDTAKQHFKRLRPYVVDPSLEPPIPPKRPKPVAPPTPPSPAGPATPSVPEGPSYAYPSGHTSASAASAALMSSLQPEKGAEFRNLVRQMAFSRVYMGVHYPSDAIEGAYLGTLVGSYVAGARPATDEATTSAATAAAGRPARQPR